MTLLEIRELERKLVAVGFMVDRTYDERIMSIARIKKWTIYLALSFLLFVVSIKGAVGSPYSGFAEIPLTIHLFLLLNLSLISLAMVMMRAVKTVSHSTVWNNNTRSHFFWLFHILGLTVIVYRHYPRLNILIFMIIALSTTFALLMVDLTAYTLIKPFFREKLNLLRPDSLVIALFSILLPWSFFSSVLSRVQFPAFEHYLLLWVFLFVYLLVIGLFVSNMLLISSSYATLGFVTKPFFFAASGAIALGISSLLLFFIEHDFYSAYYYLLIWLIPSIFGLIYYLRFGVEYPSLLQPKWKGLMPLDLSQVTTALTLAVLALSLYFTAQDHPNFVLYHHIPYLFVVLFMLPLFLGAILILTYLKTLSAVTKLRYWEYLRYGLYIHITVSSYVFSLIFLSWHEASGGTRILCTIFGLASFAFYLFFALDLRMLLKDQDIEPDFRIVDLAHYLVSLYAWFFMLFFGISFRYGRSSEFIGIAYISYPVMLFFIAFFLIAFGTYLGVTHKGFEEIMKRGIWSELSYFATYIAFLMVYFIYFSLGSTIQRFPYHNSFFLGYFSVLILEIAAMRALEMDSRYEKALKKDIVSLLNAEAHNFLRTDYLEEFWEKTISKYLARDKHHKIGFDSTRREFNLEAVDEKSRLAIAVELLLMMHNRPDVDKMVVHRKSLKETKEEIVQILGEKLLLLPEALRAEFDEHVYYPFLIERAMNDLLTHLQTFIPDAEHQMIFDELKRRDALFTCIQFEGERIKIVEGTRLDRDEFLRIFTWYLDAVGEQFPFKRGLLRELVKEEFKHDLGITIAVGDVLPIVPMGIKELDRAMAGGLVKGSTTLLITEETKAKQKFLLFFIKKGLSERMNIIYATSKRPFQQLVGELLVEVESLDHIVIIDFYEPLYTDHRCAELVEEDHRLIAPLSRIMFQRSMVKTIKSLPKEHAKIVIIDVYDDFSKYYSPKEIFEILQKQVEGLKRWNCTSVIVLEPRSYLLKRKGEEEVKKDFENIMVLSGGEKEASVIIEKLFHGTPPKSVIHLHW
ncbi:MAG: hypothetical protein EFT35_08245 [Methanophagales archaeon ANME-1-THS]|nr:MAG: hypothetical protein EFT35_08245 [Methanophagales archaeon ANME-1-THS]